MSVRDEETLVEILAVHDYGRELAAEGATVEQMRRYREWRDEVVERGESAAAVSV